MTKKILFLATSLILSMNFGFSAWSTEKRCLEQLLVEAQNQMTQKVDFSYSRLQGRLEKQFPTLEALSNQRQFKNFLRKDSHIRDLVHSQDYQKVQPVLGKYIRSREEGLFAKVAVARHAKYTLDITYFILYNDPAGKNLINEIKYALERGVDVRLQVDAWYSKGLAAKVKSKTGRIAQALLNIWNPKHTDNLASIMAETIENVNDPYNTNLGQLKGLVDWYNTYKKSDTIGYTIDPDTGKKTANKARLQVVQFNPLDLMSLSGNIFRFSMNRAIDAANLLNYLRGKPAIKKYNYNNLFTHRSHDKLVLADGRFKNRAVAVVGGANVEDLYYENNHEDQEMIIRSLPNSLEPSNVDYENKFAEYSQWFDHLYTHLGNRSVNSSIVAAIKKVISTELGSKLLDQENERLNQAGVHFNQNLNRAFQPVGTDKYVAWSGISPFNKDGSTNTKFNPETYLSRGFGVIDLDLTYTLANLHKRDRMRRANDPQFRNEANQRIRNANGAMKNIRQAFIDSKNDLSEVHIISPYLFLTQSEIKELRALLVKNKDAKLFLHINSMMTNDMWHVQSLLENKVLPALTAEHKSGVQDRIIVSMNGRSTDRRLSGKKDDYMAGLRHMKGILIKRKNGDWDKDMIEIRVGMKDQSVDQRNIGAIGTYNADWLSRAGNSETVLIVKDGTVNPELQDLPQFQFTAALERYINERLIKRAHDYKSEEYYAIRDLEVHGDKYSLMQKLSILANQDTVDYMIKKHGQLSPSNKRLYGIADETLAIITYFRHFL